MDSIQSQAPRHPGLRWRDDRSSRGQGVLTRVVAEAGESFVPAGIGKAAAAPAPAAAAPAPAASGKASGMLKRIRTIEKVLEEIRPNLQADNGDVELVDVEGKNIYVHLTGACSGCQMAAMTLGGIQQRLIEELGEFVKVLPDTEMPVALEGA